VIGMKPHSKIAPILGREARPLQRLVRPQPLRWMYAQFILWYATLSGKLAGIPENECPTECVDDDPPMRILYLYSELKPVQEATE
jgi:hypothetical protein